jgi:enoyl-CoA hydratase
MYQYLIVQIEGEVGLITLNRPKSLNAWNRPMRNELIAALREFERDAAIRAIILTGSGERAFCAGQDLKEAKDFDPQGAEDWIEEWRVLYGSIRSLSKPLVAGLNGVAAGSGFQVALLADVRIGHPGVMMGQPEINSGILSITGPWIMREILGLSRTIELTLTGRMMNAEECLRTGLIHHLVGREEVKAEAMKTAGELAAKPPHAMRLIKKRFQEVTEASFQETMDAAVRYHREAYETGEPQEYMRRFLADRAQRRKH